jgi:amidohydrolase
MLAVPGRLVVTLCAVLLCPLLVGAQPAPWTDVIDDRATQVEPQVVNWRRAIHEHPELSNREYRTAAMVATHLRSLGIDVETDVAKTGVVGVLEGSSAGPVVALRADMDALPIREKTEVPFASTDSTWYEGEHVPVMHACGHDAHVAMLMGAAEVLASMRQRLSGTVKFLFQPAEEGTPSGERGGAKVMVEEGVLQAPDVDAIFGLHVRAKTEVGTIRYRPGAFMAASDGFRITVHGKPTHGATPWDGVSPISVGARIVEQLQTFVPQEPEIGPDAAVVSVGTFESGRRTNVIPETATMTGTIRTLDSDRRREVHRTVRRHAHSTAQQMGATAEVEIRRGYPVTRNEPNLTQRVRPALRRVADSLMTTDPVMGAEDFSYFAHEVPGTYVFVGGRPPEMDREEAPSHHAPDFFVDERSLHYGIRTYAHVAMEYLTTRPETDGSERPRARRR